VFRRGKEEVYRWIFLKETRFQSLSLSFLPYLAPLISHPRPTQPSLPLNSLLSSLLLVSSPYICVYFPLLLPFSLSQPGRWLVGWVVGLFLSPLPFPKVITPLPTPAAVFLGLSVNFFKNLEKGAIVFTNLLRLTKRVGDCYI